MPNYSIIGDVTRSNFDPSEFEALERHGKAMTDQYNAMMTAYGEMQSKASMYEKLANDVKGKDSIAYKNYMDYANVLRQHTDLLATQGLTPSTMRNLIQAQSDYQRIIHPIEEAFTARERLAKEQADYLKVHPSAIFELDASQIGIDQMMRLGPSYRAKSVDKELVAERAKERFSALQKQLMDIVSQAGKDGLDLKDSRQVRTWVKTKAPWLWETMEKYGANPEDVNRLLAGDPSMEDSMLNRIVQDTYRMYGIDSWNTDYDHYSAEQNAQNRLNKMDELYTAARGEAINAIGTAKFTDYKNDMDAQILMNRERIASQERMQQKELDQKKGGGSDDGASKLATAQNTLVKEDGTEVTYDEVKKYLLDNLTNISKSTGANITETQLDKALAENGITSLSDMKDLIGSGMISNETFLNMLYNSSAGQDVMTTGDALKHGAKGWVHAMFGINPYGLGLDAVRFIHNRFVDKEEDKWNYNMENAWNNFKAVYFGVDERFGENGLNKAITLLNNGNTKEAVENARKVIKNHQHWYNRSDWFKLENLSDDDIIKELKELNSAKESMIKELVDANIGFTSTASAESDLNNRLKSYRKEHPELSDFSDGYLVQTLIDGKIRNRPEYRSEITGATKNAFIEGASDNINTSINEDGNLTSIKTVEGDNVSYDDFKKNVANAGNDFYFITNTKEPNLFTVQVGKDKYRINVNDLNQETNASVAAHMANAAMWDVYANPLNVHLRRNMSAERRQELASNFDDTTLLTIRNQALRSRKLTPEDIQKYQAKDPQAIEKYNDVMTMLMAQDLENRAKDRACSEAVRGAIMGSNEPNSVVEDNKLKKEYYETPNYNR